MFRAAIKCTPAPAPAQPLSIIILYTSDVYERKPGVLSLKNKRVDSRLAITDNDQPICRFSDTFVVGLSFLMRIRKNFKTFPYKSYKKLSLYEVYRIIKLEIIINRRSK